MKKSNRFHPEHQNSRAERESMLSASSSVNAPVKKSSNAVNVRRRWRFELVSKP